MSGPTPHPLRRSKPTVGRVVLFWGGYAGILLLAAIPKAMVPADLGPLAWGLVSSVLLLVLTQVLLRQEGRGLRDVGMRPSGQSAIGMLGGATLGVVIYGVTVATNLMIVGPIRFVRVAAPVDGAIFLAAGTYLALSVMEEIGFRGYPLRSLGLAVGPWRAQLAVAVAFSLSHLAFGWSVQTIVLGVFPSALLFGATALAFGNLAAPIGVHAALNFARWSTGETNTRGIWSMAVDDATRERMATASPVIGVAVTMVFTIALWWYGRRHAPHGGRGPTPAAAETQRLPR